LPRDSGARLAWRQAGAGLRLLRANVARLPAPLKLDLCVTWRCQSRCLTCRIWRKPPVDELSTGELLRFVATNRGAAWLDLMGGEVLLREDLGEICDAIASSWRQLALFHFATNGLLEERAVGLASRVRRRSPARVIVTVSLDGDEALNDLLRGVPGGYRRQLATFRALRALPGVEVVLGMTLSRRNVDHVDATIAAAARDCPGVGAADFHVNVAQPSAHYYGNGPGDDEFAERKVLQRALQAHRRGRRFPRSPTGWVESRYLDGLDRFLGSGRTPERCHALRSACFIDPEGVVYPCIGAARPLGRLRETDMDLGPIWSGAAARAAQQDAWHGRCPQCWTACEAYPSILGNLLRPALVPRE
jgi:MoaA/NifB/PqqE/SkfB family radical SAM enzyme